MSVLVAPSLVSPSLYGSFENDSDSHSGDMSSSRSLSDVPEEGSAVSTSPNPSTNNIPLTANSATSSTFNARSGSSRKTPSVRTLGRSSTESTSGSRRTASTSSTSQAKDGKYARPSGTLQKIRSTPRLPHDKDVELAPSPTLYWSRAAVYGTLPAKPMRAHTVTLVDTTAWLFGGCDDRDCSKDLYCLDIETLQWTHPETIGDIPPPCRAHTATLVDKKIVIYGGGAGPVYYHEVFVLDTNTRRWTKPDISTPIPQSRRAHTAVLYHGKIWIFGGGTGMMALNDVWALDVSNWSKLKWEKIETVGARPTPRGYHTANLIGNIMVVVGGSDGKDCFSDIWCLNLDTLRWSKVIPETLYRRLSHTSTQIGSYLFILGGHNGSEYCSDLQLFNLVSLQYETRAVMGKAPSQRGYHASLLADSRLFVIGGFNGGSAFDDVYVLDLAAAAYLPQVTHFTIPV